MEMAAFGDSDLSHDMTTLRKTVDLLQMEQAPSFTEESCQRVLMRLYARGAQIESIAPAPVHMQYHLPMQG